MSLDLSRVTRSDWTDDIDVGVDRTVYATKSGNGQDADGWRVYRVAPFGKTGCVLRGATSTAPTASPSTGTTTWLWSTTATRPYTR